MSNLPEIVNKSGVVITKDGRRLFGYDAELYKKMAAKEDPEFDVNIMGWIEAVLEEKLPSDDLWVCLKNGLVLIRILNKLKPKTVPRFNKTRLVPLMEMDNIHLFLKGCWTLGVPSEAMFTSTELYKRQDMGKVHRNLIALSKIAANFGCTVPPIDAESQSRPKMVSLVEEAEAKAEADPEEKVKEMREKINALKAKIKEMEGGEEGLRQEIKDIKKQWRGEKTQLIYDVSNAEKRLRKAKKEGKTAAPAPKKRDVAALKKVTLQRDSSVHQMDSMRNFAEKEKREAEKRRDAANADLERVIKQREKVDKEQKVLNQRLNDLENRWKDLLAAVEKEEKGAIDSERRVSELEGTYSREKEKAEEAQRRREEYELKKQRGRESLLKVQKEADKALSQSAVTESPLPVQPVSPPKANKRYTKLQGQGAKGEDFFFYETDVTSPEMIDYLTSQLQRLLVNKPVKYEDLTKLKELFKTDDGRRVFCLILSQTLKSAKKTIQSEKDNSVGDKKRHVLSSESFDLVLWLYNTVLHSMHSDQGDNVDFFAARILMKGSYFLCRVLPNANSPATAIEPKLEKRKGAIVENIQRFVRSDPLWDNLKFWTELYYGEITKSFKKKFSSYINLQGSNVGNFSSKERHFVLKYSRNIIHDMGEEWHIPTSTQEKFILSIVDQLALSLGEQQQLLDAIVDPDDARKKQRSDEDKARDKMKKIKKSTDAKAGNRKDKGTKKGRFATLSRKKANSRSASPHNSPSSGSTSPLSPRAREIAQLTTRKKQIVFGMKLSDVTPATSSLVDLFKDKEEKEDDSKEVDTQREKKEANKVLPTVIAELFQNMETERCLNCKGVFRQSADAEQVQLVVAKIEAGDLIQWDKEDVYVITAVFKKFLRDLAEPLSTFEVYDVLPNALELSGQARKEYMKKMFTIIPPASRYVLRRVMSLLRAFSERSDINRMTPNNLAVVFAPTIFKSRKMDLSALQDAEKYVQLTEELILHSKEILG